jgi:hypothetical protein
MFGVMAAYGLLGMLALVLFLTFAASGITWLVATVIPTTVAAGRRSVGISRSRAGSRSRSCSCSARCYSSQVAHNRGRSFVLGRRTLCPPSRGSRNRSRRVRASFLLS